MQLTVITVLPKTNFCKDLLRFFDRELKLKVLQIVKYSLTFLTFNLPGCRVKINQILVRLLVKKPSSTLRCDMRKAKGSLRNNGSRKKLSANYRIGRTGKTGLNSKQHKLAYSGVPNKCAARLLVFEENP